MNSQFHSNNSNNNKKKKKKNDSNYDNIDNNHNDNDHDCEALIMNTFTVQQGWVHYQPSQKANAKAQEASQK